MSKKLFSLIKEGGNVHVAPKTKIIPANEFSELLEAKEVLSKVKESGEKYREEVAKECEILKEEAERIGFAEGFSRWIEACAMIEKEVKTVREEIQKVLIPVALKAAKKIVGREIELSENTIVDIVSNALKGVAQHKKITIYVNRKELSILEANRTKLKNIFEHLEVLSLRERSDIAPGGCVIETEGGIINAQIENQWRVLEKAFETLMLTKE